MLVIARDPIARAAFLDRLADQVVADAGDGTDEADPTEVDVAVWDLGPDTNAAEQRLDEVARSGVPVVALVPDGTNGQAALDAGSRGILGRDAIDVTVCRRCGGPMRVLQAVTDPDDIAAELHGARAPPRPSSPGQLPLLAT